MSAQVVIVDSLDFARSGQSLSGKISVDSMGRLRDSLFSTEGALDYSVSGGATAQGKPVLRVHIRGMLNLRCQRCLGSLAYEVDISSDLLLLEDEKEMADIVDEDESIDSIVAQPNMDVLAMIEDEIILGLPLSPRHPEGECTTEYLTSSGDPASGSVFADLAKLKKHT